MNEVELLPCPFCGGKPELESSMILGGEWWRVRCPYCFAKTYHEQSPEDAAHEWNRRPE